VRLAVLVTVLVTVVALPAAGLAGTAIDRGTATITTRSGAKVVVQVEIARTSAERQRGLMNRRTLPAKAGMVFVYPQAVSNGFWMKNTLIPLDIAFYDGRGRILRIMQMTPCRADPCAVYDPGVSYRAALEVNAGSFRRWEVKAGDRIVVRTTRSG
jgi:uncharacterized membrane protein (UPF0127 family)